MAIASDSTDGFRRWDALAPLIDDIQPRTMPFHAEAYAALARGAELVTPDRDKLRLLDLGCGTGAAARAVLDVLGTRVAAVDLVDGSGDMLDLAAKRLGPFAGRRLQQPLTRLKPSDLDPTMETGPGLYDLILSGFALHHLEEEDKRSLFKKLATIIRPGAGLLLLDLYQVGPLAQGIARLAEKALAGPAWDASVAIGDAALNNVPESDANWDRPTTTAFVLESLHGLGIKPEISWSSGEFALIVGQFDASE